MHVLLIVGGGLSTGGVLTGCRSKAKVSSLDYIPADAPGVVWLPQPKLTLDALANLLNVFEKEPVGDQLKAWRFDLGRQMGVDVMDARALTAMQLDVEKPIAVVLDEGLVPRVVVLPALDAEVLATKIKELARHRFGALEERTAPNNSVVLSEVLGATKLDLFALRVVDKAVIMTEGEDAAARLQAFPTAEQMREKPFPHTFKQFRKKAEADGSPSGAAVRTIIRDVAKLVPDSFRSQDRNKPVELHGACFITPGKIEFETHVMGLNPDKLHAFSQPVGARPAFAGLPINPLLLARSDVDAATLLDIARQVPLLRGIVGLAEEKYGKPYIDALSTVLTGSGAAAIEVGSLEALGTLDAKRSPRETLIRLLDLFPISATFDLKDEKAFDDQLGKLGAWLETQKMGVVMDKAGKNVVLRGKSPTGSQVALGRQDKIAVYGIGPGAFAKTLETVTKADSGPTKKPPFEALFQPHATGFVLNTEQLIPLIEKLVEAILGNENAMVRTLVGRSVASLKHVRSVGTTLMFEGPAAGPHPTVRTWIIIQ